MKKRNLFAELSDGFDALKHEREDKMTLRKHPIESKLAPQVTESGSPAPR
jgi:putative transcriptional regulator